MKWAVGIFDSADLTRYPVACFEYSTEEMAEHAERLFDLYIAEHVAKHDHPNVRTWVAVSFEVLPAPADPRLALIAALDNLD